MIERQELHCHACQKYVQFDVDTEQSGNLVLECPNCGHEHCRVIEDGKITDQRWDQRNGAPYQGYSGNVTLTIVITNASWTNQSTYDTYTSAHISALASTPTSSNANITNGYSYGNSVVNATTASAFCMEVG
jgi:hypothetical protein